mgnify:CR=1 FL=1
MSDLENKKSPVVITIARDFGAEGHEIGRMLADELGIPLYDNELLVRASLRAGESLDKMAAYDERLAVENMAFLPDRYDARSYSDKLFQKMSQVILDLGETESCIIEGRLSDYLLRNNPNHIAVLVTAPFEDRVEIVRKKRGLNKKKGAKLVKQQQISYLIEAETVVFAKAAHEIFHVVAAVKQLPMCGNSFAVYDFGGAHVRNIGESCEDAFAV